MSAYRLQYDTKQAPNYLSRTDLCCPTIPNHQHVFPHCSAHFHRPQYDTKQAPNYLSRTDLSSRVAKLNPAWNQDSSEATLYVQFLKAVALTGSEFQASTQAQSSDLQPAI